MREPHSHLDRYTTRIIKRYVIVANNPMTLKSVEYVQMICLDDGIIFNEKEIVKANQ